MACKIKCLLRSHRYFAGSTSHMTLLADVDIACQKRFEKYVMIVIEVWLDRSDVSLKTYQKYRQLLLRFGFLEVN